MVTLDLQDAFFHISIVPAHRKFLSFAISDHHYQFKALPFGLASVPCIFTKIMVTVVSLLHSLGITVSPYIYDWLFVADSEAVLTQVAISLNLHHSLGIRVNWKKSHLTPTQDIYWGTFRLKANKGFSAKGHSSFFMDTSSQNTEPAIVQGREYSEIARQYGSSHFSCAFCKVTHASFTNDFPQTFQTSDSFSEQKNLSTALGPRILVVVVAPSEDLPGS